jgi:hypothetical protein
LDAAGADLVTGSPEEFGALIRAQQEHFARVARQTGVALD